MKKQLRKLMLTIICVAASLTMYAQWITTGNPAVGGEVLGTTNAFPLNIITSGLPRMTVTPSGFVGINTTNPSQFLDVKGTTKTKQLQVTTGAVSGWILQSSNNSGLLTWVNPSTLFTETDPKVGTLTTNMIPKWNGSSLVDSKIIEDANSNVGIGSSVPLNKLQVNVLAPNDGIRIAITKKFGAESGAAALHLTNYSTGGATWSLLSLGALNTADGPGNFCISGSPNNSSTLTTRFLINYNTGNIGIGTSMPSHKIDLVTTTANDGISVTQAGGSGAVGLELNNTSTNGRNWGIRSLGNGDAEGPGNLSIYDLTSGSNDLFIYGSSSNNVIFNSAGNIGMGTITPAFAKLEVDKNIVPLGQSETYRGVLANIQNTSPIPNGGAPPTLVGVEGNATIGNFTPNLGYAYGVSGTASHGQTNIGGIFTGIGFTDNDYGNYGIYASGYGNAVTSKNWGGYFAGNVYTTGVYMSSDQKLKNDIKPLTGALDKLMLLKPSTYIFKTEEFKPMNLPRGNQIGLIAQDLETVFPELVVDMPELKIKNKNGEESITNPSFKAVQYTGLIPVLIAGVQEQQKQIELQKLELQSVNEQQQKEINELKDLVAQLQASIGNTNGGELKVGTTPGNVSLGQNIPNPFDNSTIIPFNIPDNCKDAKIQIVEIATGRAVKINPISCNQSQISIEAGTLVSGSYSYTLIVDGKVIDTKYMVLSK